MKPEQSVRYDEANASDATAQLSPRPLPEELYSRYGPPRHSGK